MERMDAVDAHDHVTETVTQEEIYQRGLRHRIVHVLLFNAAGEMALQLRSAKKSFCPLHWSTAVGGHVQSGETYEQAALREFQEELGTTTQLTFAFTDTFTDSRTQKFLGTFTATFEGPFAINAEEVERVAFFPLDTIRSMIASGEKFHPELLFLLKKHYS